MRQRRVGVKKFSTFQCFTQPAIFAYFEFPILSNPEQTTITPLYWGTFLDKNHHKCNINTRNTHMNTIFANYLNLYVIKLKYRYLKVLHKTLQNLQNELSINHHDLTLFGTNYERSHQEEMENTGVWKKVLWKSLEITFRTLPNL